MDEEVHGSLPVSGGVDRRERVQEVAPAPMEAGAAGELERLRDEWTSVIVHELRQPVSAISTQVGILLREDLDSHIRARLIHILTSTHSLRQMVTDLSDYSRLSVGRLELEPREIEIRPLVEAVVERLVDEFGTHPVHMEFEGDLPKVMADPARLEQVIANLLTNASKHGWPNTEIVIRTTASGPGILLEITNQGAGLEPEEMQHIFDRFVRGSRSKQVIGLGLGLNIAKGLVEAHGGKIWASCTPEGLATFSFSLPGQ